MGPLARNLNFATTFETDCMFFENIEIVYNMMTVTPRQSLRTLSQSIGISKDLVRRQLILEKSVLRLGAFRAV